MTSQNSETINYNQLTVIAHYLFTGDVGVGHCDACYTNADYTTANVLLRSYNDNINITLRLSDDD